ncbi:MAG TPA: DoxX family protein [Planctomycetota bacterium]|jgi:putative oxidoreductase
MFQSMLSSFTERVYALLRIVAGLMWSFHGMQSIFHLYYPPPPVPPPPETWSQLWFGGLIELTCGLAIAFGIFASPAAFLASGTMAVAYMQFHWKFQFDSQLLPGVNQGEPALLYAFLFLFFACKGAGKWSVDSWREKRRAQPR